MKKFASIVLLVSSLTAMAADRTIYDLMYLPNAGTVYGFSDFSLVDGRAEGEVIGEDYDVNISGYNFEQTVGYSVTDTFSVQLDMNYASTKQKVDLNDALNSFGNEDTEGKTKGLSDPSLTFKYRALEDGLIIDVGAGVTVKTGDNEIDDEERDNKQGGNSFLLAGQVGQKMESFQWAFISKFERYMKSTVDTKGEGKVKDDAHNEWTFGGEILNKLDENMFLRSTLGVAFSDGYDDDEDDKTPPVTQYVIGTEFQYLFSQNLLGRVGIQYVKQNQSPFDTFQDMTFKVGATYQF